MDAKVSTKNLQDDFTNENNTFGITLSWKALNVHVKKTSQRILNNFSGCVKNGELIGIIGASGSGKTTFLDYVGGFTRDDLNINGELKLYGDYIDQVKKSPFKNNSENQLDTNYKVRQTLKEISAYVLQQDILISTLTVEETFMYQAKLKQPKTAIINDDINYPGLDYEEKIKNVIDKIINLMALDKVRGQRIGDGIKRGLSGGERKRVCIGCELVTDPSVLLLDEPTTGLDSLNAENVINVLQNLAKKQGKLVIMTIHQPSVEILAKYDELIVLHTGIKVYEGHYTSIRDYFDKLNIKIPEMVNPFEYLMNLQNLSENSIKILRENLGSSVEKLFDEETAYRIQKFLADKMNSLDNNVDFNKNFTMNTKTEFDTEDLLEPSKNLPTAINKINIQSNGTINTFWPSFCILVSRGNKLQYRDSRYFINRFALDMVTLFIYTFFFRQMGYDYEGVRNREGAIYGMMNATTLIALQSVILKFHENNDLLVKELRQKLYPISAYFCSVGIPEMPFNIQDFLLIGIPVYFIANLNFDTWEHLFVFCIINLSAWWVGEAFGILISIIANNAETTIQLAPVVLVPPLLLSGYFINDNNVRWFFTPFKYLSYDRYLFFAYARNEFENLDGCKEPFLCEIWKNLNATSSVWTYIGIVWVYGLVIRIISCGVFYLKYIKY